MARYFMHLRDSIDELLDPEGQEFASRAFEMVKFWLTRSFLFA